MFIGLSDGAHMDVVRRVGGLSNEQVLTNYYPDKDKLEDMRKELMNDSLLKELDESDRKFNSLYLIDDLLQVEQVSYEKILISIKAS